MHLGRVCGHVCFRLWQYVPMLAGTEQRCAAAWSGYQRPAALSMKIKAARLRVRGGHAAVAVCEECMLHVALKHGGHAELHKVVHCN